ncbi:MAG: ABC transporter substrate-binding protein [Betaproteobacteria bacterium]|nr:MAG: ABC transporter substrate-binding protein [Betaproteobacteria bacterium]
MSLGRRKTMSAATVRVLSAGAIEPGLTGAARAFGEQHGVSVEIAWATTPNIRRRVAADEVHDILIVPADAAVEFEAAGKLVRDGRVPLGAVGVGVAVRAGAGVPDVSTVERLTAALLGAESVIFTLATSGIYVESMLKRQGLYERLAPKITRFETGPEMMAHLIHGRGDEFCLGAIVELMMFRDKGVSYVGPLPSALQRFTEYVAARTTAGENPNGARRFLAYLATAEARTMFADCGVETAAG